MATVRTADITSTSGSDFNSNWATTLEEVGWVQGASYTLTMTITANLQNNSGFITLGDGHYLVSQGGDSDNAVYFGVNTVNNNNMPSDWQQTYTYAKDGNTTTLTEAEGKSLAAWTMASATSSQSRTWTTKALTLTLSYDADTNDTVVQYSYAADTKVDRFILTDTSLDLTNLSARNTVTFNGNGSLLVTPEPATATLSLLALAGLASRRRRH